MPNGSSKRAVEEKMNGAFILRIAERACTMDIDPSITRIQKCRNTVMHDFPHKDSNFQRDFYFPNKVPNLLGNGIVSMVILPWGLVVFLKYRIGFVYLK